MVYSFFIYEISSVQARYNSFYATLHTAVRNQTAMFVLYEFAAIFELSPRDLIEWEKGHSVYGAGPVITHVPDPAHEKVQGVLERVFYIR